NIVPDENGNLRVGHFGLKAQVPDLLFINALALQHELGITNPISPDEDLPQGNPIPPNCSTASEPNDNGAQMIAMYHFVNYLAPNTPGSGNANGQSLFTSVGCAECHLPTYTTKATVLIPKFWQGSTIESKAMENQPVNLYSDLLLHDLGGKNGDGIPMGLATATQWRTAPLWGISIKLQSGIGLMHDGRQSAVAGAVCRHGGEARTIVGTVNALSASDQSDLNPFVSAL